MLTNKFPQRITQNITIAYSSSGFYSVIIIITNLIPSTFFKAKKEARFPGRQRKYDVGKLSEKREEQKNRSSDGNALKKS